MHELMEGGVGIPLWFFNRWTILGFGGGERFLTKCGCRCFSVISQVPFEQKLPGLLVFYEDGLFVISLSVGYVVSKVGVLGSERRIQTAPDTVNKVVGRDRIAIRPTRITSQVKNEL